MFLKLSGQSNKLVDIGNHVRWPGTIWLFFSGLYLTKIMPVSPVQLAYLLVFFLMFLLFSHKEKFLVDHSSLYPFAGCIYFLTLFVSSPPAAVLNILITFSSPLIVYSFFCNRVIKVEVFNKYFLFYSVVFILDGVWRFLHPAEMDLERLAELGITFQIYKLNTFMYMDSNFVGLQAICTFSFMCWFILNGVKLNKFIPVLLFMSVLLSLSRAAIIAMFIVIILTYILKRNISILFINLFLLLLSICIVFIVFYFFSKDISFLSKFHILEVAGEYFYKADFITLIFGVGVGNAKDVLGIGAHNLFVGFIVETGIFGFTLLLTLLIYWFCILKRSWFILVFPTILTAMSLGTSALPYFFTMVTIAILIKRNKLQLN